MTTPKVPGRLALPLVFLPSLYAAGIVLAPVRLSSQDELNSRYAVFRQTQTVNNVRVFWGYRKSPKPKDPVHKEFFRFDTKRLEVTPLLPAALHDKHFAAARGIHDLALDPAGAQLAVAADFPRQRGISLDILLIDLDTSRVHRLLADGRRNYGLAFSPDGRLLAYYSTDADLTVARKGLPARQNAAHTIDVSTGQVQTYVEPVDKRTTMWESLGAPEWLDKNRVLFAKFRDEQPVAGVDGFLPPLSDRVSSASEYRFAILAYPQTGKTRRFFMAGHRTVRWLIDRKKSNVIFYNDSQVVQTDFDLKNPSLVAEVDPSKRLAKVRLDDGEVKYDVIPLPQP